MELNRQSGRGTFHFLYLSIKLSHILTKLQEVYLFLTSPGVTIASPDYPTSCALMALSTRESFQQLCAYYFTTE